MKNPIAFSKAALYGPFLQKIMACLLFFSGMILLSSPGALARPLSATVSITQHPVAVSVCSGSTAFFTVVASGTAPVTYQWQSSPNGTTWTSTVDGAVYSGSASPRLAISAASVALSGVSYHCIVTDAGGPVTSNAAVLTVSSTTSPFAASIFQNGSTYQCSNNTSGSVNGSNAVYNYQWQVSTDNGITFTTISGGAYTNFTTNVLNFTVNNTFNGNLYQYQVNDPTSGCSATSGEDTFYLIKPPAQQAITPTSGSICPGGNFAFSVPDSSAFYTYQWQSSTNGVTWASISNSATYNGTGTFALAITNTSTALRYRTGVTLTAHGISCTVASSPAPLSIKTLPAITAQPPNDTVCANSNGTFKVTASGTSPTYVWQTDNGTGGTTWTTVTGATAATLTLSAVTPSMSGYRYQAIVTGACGSPLTTSSAILKVNSSGTWLGTTDTAWENGNNWCGGVPVQAEDVLIPATAPRMPLISAGTITAYSNTLTIQSGALLTISGGVTSMNGPFTIPGSVAYTGTANQSVLPANFGSLSISGSGNKILSSNSAITNTLTLGGSAMLVTGNNILTMNAGSNPIAGPSFSGTPTSWIVTGNGSGGAGNTGTGGLRMLQLPTSGSPVLFPVGPTPTSYNPLQLTNGGAVNDFTVAVNDQYIPGASTNAVIDRTWLVSAANAGSSNISLGMLWRAADEPGGFDRTHAVIVRSNGTTLVQQSAAAAAAGSNPYTTSGGSFSTLTQFTVGTSTLIVLRLGLSSFNAQWINTGTAGLSWIVDPQYQGLHFIIQRSADGVHFTDIGKIMGVTGKTSYNFIDGYPGSGDILYRLELVDLNQDITFSHFVQLSAGKQADRADLAPSVTDQANTTLLLSLNKGGNIVSILMDAAGHIVWRNAISLGAGAHSLSLDCSHLAKGIYFLRLAGDQGMSKVLTLIKR